MAIATLVIGESGTGKSTSIRNLDPVSTYIINVLDKPLPFRGARKNYFRSTRNNPNGNYFGSDSFDQIISCISAINSQKPHIKTLIIDDWQYVMCNEFMRRASEKGFEKFTEIGQHAWKIIKELTLCRDDLNVFVLSHSNATEDGKFKCKTIGKLLDEKISIEGMFTVVLHSLIVDNAYCFLTQNDGSHLAKSPIELFSNNYIDNDLNLVVSRLREYYNEDVEVEESEETPKVTVITDESNPLERPLLKSGE